MAVISLAKGREILVDEVDVALVSAYRWRARLHHGATYAISQMPTEHGRKTISLHRLIMGFPASGIDHRNGNGLDCTRKNLRLATNGQNRANTRVQSRLGFKGIFLMPGGRRSNPWRAEITAGGVRLRLGCFSTPELAARAYDVAARHLFGEFACVNFPEPGERGARLTLPPRA